jgi:ABC-type nitrate/sulfonate/bicarbonate transport system permease component
LVNKRVGAYTYNLFHHRAIALIVVAVGLFLANNLVIAIGILLFAHSSFDRMMGYGLKFKDDFKHTSLGWMGNRETDRFADK